MPDCFRRAFSPQRRPRPGNGTVPHSSGSAASPHPGWSPGLFTVPGLGTGFVDNDGRVSINGDTVAYIEPGGMSGIFSSVTLLTNHICDSWPFLPAFVSCLAVTVLSFVGIVALIILLPVVGFLLPFLPALLLIALALRLFGKA